MRYAHVVPGETADAVDKLPTLQNSARPAARTGRRSHQGDTNHLTDSNTEKSKAIFCDFSAHFRAWCLLNLLEKQSLCHDSRPKNEGVAAFFGVRIDHPEGVGKIRFVRSISARPNGRILS